eukprot:2543372-Prymnesium_polylepis.1
MACGPGMGHGTHGVGDSLNDSSSQNPNTRSVYVTANTGMLKAVALLSRYHGMTKQRHVTSRLFCRVLLPLSTAVHNLRPCCAGGDSPSPHGRDAGDGDGDPPGLALLLLPLLAPGLQLPRSGGCGGSAGGDHGGGGSADPAPRRHGGSGGGGGSPDLAAACLRGRHIRCGSYATRASPS